MERPNLVVASSRWDSKTLARVLEEKAGVSGDFSRLTISHLAGTIMEGVQPGLRLLQQSIHVAVHGGGAREVYLVSGNPDIGRAAREISSILPSGRRVRIVSVHAEPPIERKERIVCCCSELCSSHDNGLTSFLDGARVISVPNFPGMLIRDPRFLDHFLKDVAEKSGDATEVAMIGHPFCEGYVGHHMDATAEDVQYLGLRLAEAIRLRNGRAYHGAIRGWMAEVDETGKRVAGLRLVHQHE